MLPLQIALGSFGICLFFCNRCKIWNKQSWRKRLLLLSCSLFASLKKVKHFPGTSWRTSRVIWSRCLWRGNLLLLPYCQTSNTKLEQCCLLFVFCNWTVRKSPTFSCLSSIQRTKKNVLHLFYKFSSFSVLDHVFLILL